MLDESGIPKTKKVLTYELKIRFVLKELKRLQNTSFKEPYRSSNDRNIYSTENFMKRLKLNHYKIYFICIL